MKIRTGFVSNSSSSSFVVQVSKQFPDVFSLAKHMIKCREWNTRDSELCLKLDALRENRNASICFSTCNYYTYIVRQENAYLVDTCNNHDFKLPEVFPKEIEGFPNWDADEGFDFSNNGMEFWYPEYGITAQTIPSSLKDESYCPICFSDYVLYEGKVVCPKCLEERKAKKNED